jgi:hypothetical protein
MLAALGRSWEVWYDNRSYRPRQLFSSAPPQIRPRIPPDIRGTTTAARTTGHTDSIAGHLVCAEPLHAWKR